MTRSARLAIGVAAAGAALSVVACGRTPTQPTSATRPASAIGADAVATGIVVDEFGTPVSGVSVQPYQAPGSAVTDERGAFEIATAANATSAYVLVALSREGFESTSAYLKAAAAPPPPTTIRMLEIPTLRLGIPLDLVLHLDGRYCDLWEEQPCREIRLEAPPQVPLIIEVRPTGSGPVGIAPDGAAGSRPLSPRIEVRTDGTGRLALTVIGYSAQVVRVTARPAA